MRSDSTPAWPRDLLAVWNTTCDRILGVVTAASADIANVPVPTVPSATVRDLMSHLLRAATRGVGEVSTALPVAGSGDRSASIARLTEDWRVASRSLGLAFSKDPAAAAAFITGAAMCEHDLRTALDMPGARDDESIKVALDELSGLFSDRAMAAGLPALRVTVEQWGSIIGVGHAVGCVVADRFEFVRGMSGRRSAAEIRRWNWGVEPDPYLPAIAAAPLPIREIRERDPRVPEHMRDREFVL